MKNKYTFKKQNITVMIWADSLEAAAERVGLGYSLWSIDK